MAHVAAWKKDEVKKLAGLLTDNPVVGIAKIGGIPGPQMQEMRASLRGKVEVVGCKNRLLKLAIQEAAKSRPGLEQLEAEVDGQMAIIATQNNPFKLYKELQAGATMAPLKGGAPAPNDIDLKKGPTPFGPGPIVGEFQKVGIPAKIDAGKVVISKNCTPVKEGEIVSAGLALMLAKLEIKPVELKINLRAAFEQDTLFMPDVLNIDEDAVFAQVALAARTAHEVALEAVWPLKSTVQELVDRKYRADQSLALGASWINSETIEELAKKAYKIAVAVAIESGANTDDAVAQAYANVLATIGKTEGDLSDDVKERLSNYLSVFAGAPAEAAPAAEAAPEEEEEEEVSEDEAAAGLGDLFG